MGRRLTVEEFDQLYGTVKASVWRWECQPAYHEPDEQEPFSLWERGEPDDLAWLEPWLATLRRAVQTGQRFQRVRMHHDPPTIYQRWGIEIAPTNVAAGEEVRILPEHHARGLDLPGYDFCILDDETVARMHFGAQGMTGAELLTDARAVDRHRSWRDAAWNHAMPVHQYRDEYTAAPRSP